MKRSFSRGWETSAADLEESMKIRKWRHMLGLVLCINELVWRAEKAPLGPCRNKCEFFWLICAMLAADESSPSPPSFLLLSICQKASVGKSSYQFLITRLDTIYDKVQSFRQSLNILMKVLYKTYFKLNLCCTKHVEWFNFSHQLP